MGNEGTNFSCSRYLSLEAVCRILSHTSVIPIRNLVFKNPTQKVIKEQKTKALWIFLSFQLHKIVKFLLELENIAKLAHVYGKNKCIDFGFTNVSGHVLGYSSNIKLIASNYLW